MYLLLRSRSCLLTISCFQLFIMGRDGFDNFIENNKNNSFFIIHVVQKL